jgi:hypothetical protein
MLHLLAGRSDKPQLQLLHANDLIMTYSEELTASGSHAADLAEPN